MPRSILYGILILLGLLYFANPSNVAKTTQVSTPQAPADDIDNFVVGPNWSDMFDWKLLKAFKSQKNKNVIISPLSLKIVLALLYVGSSSNTQVQLQRILNFNENTNVTNRLYKSIVTSLQKKHENFTVNLGTNIFMKLTPEQKFQAIADDYYNTGIVKVDFGKAEEASKTINEWAERITEGHIRELVHPDDLHNLVMVVVNALYFKGSWLKQFPRSLSHRGQFYISTNNTIHVDYMAIDDYFYYADCKELEARIVRVPYQGEHYVMYFMLPHYKAGLGNLLDKLNPDELRRCLNLTDLTYVDIIVPKFKFDFQSKMDTILSDMGLDSIFSNAASFPGIVRGDTVKLIVSSIIQKAGIEVNEEGTTAFAATDVQVVNKFGDVRSGVFNATHPFLFFIEDQVTGTILFSGKVENPIQSDPRPLSTLNDRRPAAGGTGSHVTNPLNLPNGSNGFGPNSVPLSSQANGYYTSPINPKPANLPRPSYQPQQPAYDQQSQDRRFNFLDFEIMMRLDANNENILISPASIKATLAMILEAAGGDSAEQIKKLLRVMEVFEARQRIKDFVHGLGHNSRTILEAGHGIFVTDKFHADRTFTDYKKTIEDNYEAYVDRINFSNPIETSRIINSWVSKITHNLITDVVNAGKFNQNAGLLLCSALYFKGDWKYEFNPTLTQPRCFHAKNNNCINVDMMQITETFKYDFNEDMDAHVVELPYNDNNYSMLLIVPQKKQFINIAADINHTDLNKILKKMEATEVILHLPKFEIDYSTDLKEVLASMGVIDIFSRNANLTGLTSSDNLNINSMVHRTRIEVGEKGTIAAGVTVASVVPLIGSSSPVVTADHPFGFLIYNNAKEYVIFEGVVYEPKEVYRGDGFSYTPVNNVGDSFQGTPTNNAGNAEQQPIYQPYGQAYTGSRRTNPVRLSPGIQQGNQQQLRTSNPLPLQPFQNNRASDPYFRQTQNVQPTYFNA